MTASDTPEIQAKTIVEALDRIWGALLRLQEIEEQLSILVQLAGRLRDDVRAERRF